jgi:hypothetical protein
MLIGYNRRWSHPTAKARRFERRQHSNAGSAAEVDHSSTEQTQSRVSTCNNGVRKDTVAGERKGEAKSCLLAERRCSDDRRAERSNSSSEERSRRSKSEES